MKINAVLFLNICSGCAQLLVSYHGKQLENNKDYRKLPQTWHASIRAQG